MNRLPCEGLKVIELASVLAGPSVGQFFAELGASVLKIESPATGGDVTRSWKLQAETARNSRPAYFTSVNWGKTSLMLNLKKEQDRQRLYEEVREATILVASYKPGDAAKLGVDYAVLSSINPQLIYGSITGYGQNDPRVGYDAIVQAETGYLYMNGSPEGESVKMPVALMDVLAAHQLKEALLLALWEKEKTGKGSEVSVSLFDSGIAALSNQATNWLNAGHIPQRMGSGHPNIVPYGNTFPTQDGDRVLLAVGTDRQFEALCQLLDWTIEERFQTNLQRVHLRQELLPLLEQRIREWESEPLVQGLTERKVPAAKVNNLSQVFELPQAQALLFQAEGLQGIRQFVAQSNSWEVADQLGAPPELPTYTEESK